MRSPRVLLADKKSPGLQKLARALTQAKLKVHLAHDLPSVRARYAQSAPDVVVVGGGLPGQKGFSLCRELDALDPACVTLALVPDAKGQRAAERAGADEALIKPQPKAVEAAVRALALVRALRLEHFPQTTPVFEEHTGFYTFEHFKHALFVELKRARRHKFPISVILASIEAPGRAEGEPELRKVLMGGLAVAVRSATRGIDLPVAYGQHNVLILLPHTPKAGAEIVARRVLFKIARSQLRLGSSRVVPRLALGIASTDAGERPFSDLIREAQLHLKEAEARGGNCLVAA